MEKIKTDYKLRIQKFRLKFSSCGNRNEAPSEDAYWKEGAKSSHY